MCGIYCEIRPHKHSFSNPEVEQLLKQRGPDHYDQTQDECDTSSGTISLTFAASVLGLRREEDNLPVLQPLEFPDGRGYLCWNGEAWKYDGEPVIGSDTKFVAEKLSEVPADATDFHQRTLAILGRIRGPFAFIYYNRLKNLLYYGRDCVGRRSLLCARTPDGSFFLSSVAVYTISEHWEEIEADGIYTVDISKVFSRDSSGSTLLSGVIKTPYLVSGLEGNQSLTVPWATMNIELPYSTNGSVTNTGGSMRLHTGSKAVADLLKELTASMSLRLPDRANVKHPPIAILFSGGLDCTLLARLAHECLHENTTIDLLNVAFENPRVHKKLNGDVPAYETCPDRITARQSLAELQNLCPHRNFNLICVNIPYSETLAFRDEIRALIYPHDTEMDVSIAMALFFAARGPTQSKVLFSGLGADELFGGYQRHALAYKRGGYTTLLEELQLDTDRLGKRNLGRDDRAISRWGKEARYPFLDEDVIARALSMPIWEKVGFGFEPTEEGVQHVKLDDKLVLRCIAKKLGMSGVAEEKKRAIQFGSRSAKMESGRTRGTDKLT